MSVEYADRRTVSSGFGDRRRVMPPLPLGVGVQAAGGIRVATFERGERAFLFEVHPKFVVPERDVLPVGQRREQRLQRRRPRFGPTTLASSGLHRLTSATILRPRGSGPFLRPDA